MDNLHFLPNNILTRIFKELLYIYIYIYIYVRMSTNNIYIGKSSFASHIKHTAEATNMDLLHS